MFQNNVVGKLFTVTQDVLSDLELCDVAVKHWNDHLGVWVKVREGSVIDLMLNKIGNNVFFKAANVTRYHGFQDLLKAASPRCVLHLRNNLPGARASVHDAKLHRLIQPSSSAMLSTQSQPELSFATSSRTLPLRPRYASQAITDAIKLALDDGSLIQSMTVN
jgi:hypothetical protein